MHAGLEPKMQIGGKSDARSVYSSQHARAERGSAADCDGGSGGSGAECLYGQAIRQGFQPSPVQKAGEKTEFNLFFAFS